MFVDVKIINGSPNTLTYQASLFKGLIGEGTLVKVPLRNTHVVALVTKVYTEKPNVAFVIREIQNIEPFPNDPHYFPFIKKLAAYHALDTSYFITRIHAFLSQKESEDIPQLLDTIPCNAITLTDEQAQVVDYLSDALQKNIYAPTIVHGVTGSGKTEIYKKLILQAFSENKTTLLLLPEVTLAVQFERLLKAQLPTTLPILSFHSATQAATKKALWKAIQAETPHLIIGVHLPVLLPIKNLGLIIIDEEHEIGFQEKKHPKINTKYAAILRAQEYKIPLLLGSATPSISSLFNVKQRGWKLFQLKKRFAGAFPAIIQSPLIDHKRRRSFWITDVLYKALKDRLAKKEQAIVFLNRRGICFFLQCKECSYIFSCNSCSVSLTVHTNNFLRCHYCRYFQKEPAACPTCKKTEFLNKGIGTQQIVTILEKLLPEARIARADMDSTVNKKQFQKTITDFESGELDILVGTQTITKGYHFPKVTLVGVIWADSNINFPIYNAQETALQQLIQVAGRAGRQSIHSEVIIQSMSDHPLFKYLHEIDYLSFYDNEIEQRTLIGYPPLIRFAEIEIKHKKEAIVEQESFLIAAQLMNHPELTVLGPAEPPVSKINKIFSRKIYLKAQRFEHLTQAYHALNREKLRSDIFFTPNPLT